MSSKACPQCGATLTVDPRFVTWCEHCGWNVDPSVGRQEDPPAPKRAERAKQRGERLFQRLSDRQIERSRASRARRLAFAIAIVVHAATFAITALGAFVLVTGIPHLSSTVIGAVLIFFGLLLRPHLGKVHRHAVRLSRAQAPALYAVTDAVAESVGAQPAAVIVVDGDFNAAHGRVGLRRHPVLWLGLPLWDVLIGSERVALLAHEFGHQVNGDVTHGFIVGTALQTLADWYQLFNPRVRRGRMTGSSITNAVFGFLRLGIAAVFRAEASLLLESIQKAEYYAEALGARVASARAAIGCTDRLHLARACVQAMEVAVRRGQQDIWTAEREFVATLPRHEYERLRRLDALHGTAIDATHPPTNLRVALLHNNSSEAPWCM